MLTYTKFFTDSFASLLGLPITVIPNAGHQLPKDYVSSLLDNF